MKPLSVKQLRLSALKIQRNGRQYAFYALGSPLIPEHERLKNYKTPGSLSRHFVDRHIKAYPKSMRVKCNVCNKELEHKAALMNHAEGVHGIVSRLPLSALGPI